MIRCRALVFLLLIVVSATDAFAHDREDAALRLIRDHQAAGQIDDATARMLELQRALAPQDLPQQYRDAVEGPLLCATPLVIEIERHLAEYGDVDRRRIEQWLAPRTSLRRAAVYTSPSGRFALSYEESGGDAVPLTDVDPTNGIPDFVERVAVDLDTSWTVEFEQNGFVAPDVSVEPYAVSFADMGSYGYTTTVGAGAAGTRIVLNSTFEGFPSNDDPAGPAIGAAKVTAAHELKHSSQFATSQWSETGLWVEVDATWVEDIVFDEVNDYINYIDAGSPISNPSLPLDSGGSGAYEDCVWQHYMSQTWGVQAIESFWQRRAAVPQEDVMISYNWTFLQSGSSILEGFVDFATWNLATGSRAVAGYGYREASLYPTSPLDASATTLPTSFNGVLQRYAARFYEVTGFTAGENGLVWLDVTRSLGSPLRMNAAIVTPQGQWIVEPIVLDAAVESVSLQTPLDQIDTLYVVVAHGGIGGASNTVQIDVREEIRPPQAAIALDVPSVTFQVERSTLRTRTINLQNVGEEGSLLEYDAIASAELDFVGRAPLARSIEGSFLAVDVPTYAPGSTATLQFTVGNASLDFEYLAGVELNFPAGVTVTASSDMTGVGATPLVSNAATGDAVTLIWSDDNGGWGNIPNGRIATASVDLQFDAALVGDLSLSYRILGDGYGAAPHEVSDVILLDGPDAPVFELLAPVGPAALALGGPTFVEWTSATTGPMRIELSRDGGANWDVLVDSTANDGNWTWWPDGTSSDQCLLRVVDVDGGSSVTSQTPFLLYQRIPWLTVSPANGSIPAGNEIGLDLTFDATGLAPGLYACELRIRPRSPGSSVVIPILMQVTQSSTPSGPDRGRAKWFGATPNPFNPVTTMRLLAYRASRVRLTIYDERGRRVRRLVDEVLPAGEHSLQWNSLDDAGRSVSSAVYYYVAEIDGERLTGKLSLVK